MGSRRWFHPNLSGLDAETLLKERGVDGSFLVRPSKSTPGDFTLSIRRGGEISHIKIQNSGDYYDLYKGEQFATLAELVQHYTEKQGRLKETNGDILECRYPLHSEDPTPERWFHCHINGQDAEQMLGEKGKNGSFLVRESSSRPEAFVLSVKVQGKVAHVLITKTAGKYDICHGGDQFDSLNELIEHYKESPLVEKNGNVIHLKQAFNATRMKASAIESRIAVLDRGSGTGRNTVGFWDEFEQLQLGECKQLHSRKEGERPEHKRKNKYKNILPFDHTRVILRDGNPDLVGSDYINANIITAKYNIETGICPPSDCYIATQGCLKDTVADFWRMVWQENSRIIVMATQLFERGKNKCYRYWPNTNERKHEHDLYNGKITVNLLRETDTKDYILRELRLSLEGSVETRDIYQYHFMAWPDHGVPRDPGPILNILEEIDRKQASIANPGPIVVHCSAGIGRTGTFIVIDMILKRIKMQGLNCEIDILKTIQAVRAQRSGLVQTEAQYKFVYIAVKHYMETFSQRLQAEQQSSLSKRRYTNTDFCAIDFSGAVARQVGTKDEESMIQQQRPPTVVKKHAAAKPTIQRKELYENITTSNTPVPSPSTERKSPAIPPRRY